LQRNIGQSNATASGPKDQRRPDIKAGAAEMLDEIEPAPETIPLKGVTRLKLIQ
jgi:hypothetical protein